MTNSIDSEELQQAGSIPVIAGLHAQGDVIVVPAHLLGLTPRAGARWQEVPAEGIEILRGAVGGNPHTLVAEPGTCRWTTDVFDPEWLAVGMFVNDVVAYLMHPEHGATGSAPGTYVIRRQREHRHFQSGLVSD